MRRRPRSARQPLERHRPRRPARSQSRVTSSARSVGRVGGTGRKLRRSRRKGSGRRLLLYLWQMSVVFFWSLRGANKQRHLHLAQVSKPQDTWRPLTGRCNHLLTRLLILRPSSYTAKRWKCRDCQSVIPGILARGMMVIKILGKAVEPLIGDGQTAHSSIWLPRQVTIDPYMPSRLSDPTLSFQNLSKSIPCSSNISLIFLATSTCFSGPNPPGCEDSNWTISIQR